MANLVEGTISECNRVRELVKEYEAIGPAGAFGAWMMRRSISNAEQALATGDVVHLMAAYKDLKGHTG